MASHAPDIITLDNLSQTLTPWNPQGESQLYAIVDMGRYIYSPYYQALSYLITPQQRYSILYHISGAPFYTPPSSHLLNSRFYLTF